MKENSMQALRGFFNSSFLHDKVLELIKEFEMQLLTGKKEINYEKDKTIKHQNDEIK